MDIEQLQRDARAYQCRHPRNVGVKPCSTRCASRNLELARSLTGTAADPFCVDERVGAFRS